MAKKKTKLKSVAQTPKVYEFKVSLQGTSPVVWRSFLAHEIIDLSELHMLIQMTMGWEARHPYEFKINGKSYGEIDSDFENDMIEAEGITFGEAIKSSKNFTYIYDFGDGWQHDVEIVSVLEHDSRMIYPVCIGGENACPPEDCGGPPGFEDLKKALAGKDCEEKD
ncbi:MAG: plasmid pRiA4b ORF-3 family protein [Bdellovibrionaceae bacterium]|nr:plasmid pRiA4b ORF-3 family protein [Pseudobdellovibrionaceae bacterium]NUM57396.1 plasmid pRiA4b ORF-3 family protein [Pseudobdellovibrionaceae bacterium]